MPTFNQIPRTISAWILLWMACVGTSQAADSPLTADRQQELKKIQMQGVNFLKNSQLEDGLWTTETVPGISALVTTALLESGVPASDPVVAKALKRLEGYVQKDGGIYYEKSNHRNYETCISIMAFHAANKDGRYNSTIKNAEKFLRGLQWDEGEGIESSDTAYGGAGYGGHSRPDLSNTQFLIEALKKAGAKADDPAIQKALVFVSRTQNLESEYNTTPFASKIDDGGFYYTPAAGGTSQAGKTPDDGLRSYGSMTYAGLKSMIYAGVNEDDKRVKAANEWIRRHYTLKENPGMELMGLFYYFHTFAKALDAMKVDQFKDAEGTQHNWRAELIEQLASLQQENGSWSNKQKRWYESDPNLATAYALLALSYCQPAK
ncbi:prenyltransferase/squalene oxidase repeat-containing protein [Gimesia maris]|uniref:prenyltransferase/squalene oxidase repeat-containing protein n=1 Tax=Gimesia maris TaxID=122 RepID=UPI00241F69B4|nr:prenyltransferase/squalene oxidase repeat-containing protein [Gimesia maris]|tara:strand:+ start:67399 stop:68529 length:1131 start_codon:yes stop_codon:yes gene_type:complete